MRHKCRKIVEALTCKKCGGLKRADQGYCNKCWLKLLEKEKKAYGV